MRRCLSRQQSRSLFANHCRPILGKTRRVRCDYNHVLHRHGCPASAARKLHTQAQSATSPAHASKHKLHQTQDTELPVTAGHSLRPPKSQQNDPEAWIIILDQFLPKDLRKSSYPEQLSLSERAHSTKDIIIVLTLGRSKTGVDLLTHMVLAQSRHVAALNLVEILLCSVASSLDSSTEELPSNIRWPVSFDDFKTTSFDAPAPAATGYPKPISWPEPFDSLFDSRESQKPMQALLPFLAELTLAASSKPDIEADLIMGIVHRIVARMHNLGLVPSEVYDYSLPKQTTAVQRPPILHLVSSRILTTISDAVWRSQQDFAIAQALSAGKSMLQIGREVPGGRFRLRVGKLGAEVWLEFLLWCCVDGGYASAGTRIVNSLRQQHDNPWHAVHWCSDRSIHDPPPKIDWVRVKRRFGGPVGRLEGYSIDKPFVDIPSRTISAEVILALVDSLFSNVNIGIRGSGLSVRKVIQNILDTIGFLDPNALGPKYLDYLAVRFLQTESLYVMEQPDDLWDWRSAITQLRLSQTKRSQPTHDFNYDLNTILSHSELLAGISHQGLQAFINRSNAVQAVSAFSHIQHDVDSSKLESMDRFLTYPQSPQIYDIQDQANQKARLDYVASHGQLPPYKMAAFLNMITEARLFGLGDWLIDSGDIDGPLIPLEQYPLLSIFISLTKYADEARDRDLMKAIITSRSSWRLKPSLNVLRSLVNAMISVSDWNGVVNVLQSLKDVPGGGFSPKIVSRLAAKLRRCEALLEQGHRHERIQNDILQSFTILKDVLGGVYDGGHADFTLSVKRVFNQQIGYLLRLFENTPSRMLQEIARLFKSKFRASNKSNLAPQLFNDMLGAIVEANGAAEGRRMWELFCQNPNHQSATSAGEIPILEDHVDLEMTSFDDDDDAAADVGVIQNEFPPTSTDSSYPISVSYDQMDRIPLDLAGQTLDQSSFDPVVIPNVQTLNIIVRRANVEKAQLRGAMKDREGELYALLRWAEHFYKAFGLSKKDIDAEVRLPAALKEDSISLLKLRSLYSSQRDGLGIKEKSKLNLGDKFSLKIPSTKLRAIDDGKITDLKSSQFEDRSVVDSVSSIAAIGAVKSAGLLELKG